MSNEWQNGLCGCFSNFTVCIITYFAPCYTAGKNAEAVGDDCLTCGLIQLVPFANIYFAAKTRSKIREQKGIDGGFLGDCMTVWCCYCCALSQSAQEVNSMGGNMGPMEIDRQ